MERRAPVLIVIICLITILAIVYGIEYWFPSHPPPPPPPPGEEPTVTFKTDVHLERPWYAPKPHIAWIKSEQTGVEYYNAKILWFPWKGTLKLTVNYPKGQIIKLSKPVVVEWNSEITVTFYWKTKQTGTHYLTAELYDEEGNLVDSISEEVTR